MSTCKKSYTPGKLKSIRYILTIMPVVKVKTLSTQTFFNTFLQGGRSNLNASQASKRGK